MLFRDLWAEMRRLFIFILRKNKTQKDYFQNCPKWLWKAHFPENSPEIFIVRTCCWASVTLLCLNGNCRHSVLLKIKKQVSQMMGTARGQMYTRDRHFWKFWAVSYLKKYTRVLWNIQNQNIALMIMIPAPRVVLYFLSHCSQRAFKFALRKVQ